MAAAGGRRTPQPNSSAFLGSSFLAFVMRRPPSLEGVICVKRTREFTYVTSPPVIKSWALRTPTTRSTQHALSTSEELNLSPMAGHVYDGYSTGIRRWIPILEISRDDTCHHHQSNRVKVVSNHLP